MQRGGGDTKCSSVSKTDKMCLEQLRLGASSPKYATQGLRHVSRYHAFLFDFWQLHADYMHEFPANRDVDYIDSFDYFTAT